MVYGPENVSHQLKINSLFLYESYESSCKHGAVNNVMRTHNDFAEEES